jgi:hypothetical protein
MSHSKKSAHSPKKVKQDTSTAPSKLDLLLQSYATHIGEAARPWAVIGILLLFFGLLGLVWMIPFPQLAFLQKMNMHLYLNWASFVIAFGIYYYLRVGPTLSYGVLLLLGVFSYGIVQIEYWTDRGGPAEWIVFLIVAVLGAICLAIAKRQLKQPISNRLWLGLIGHGPLWLWHFVFKRFKIPY